MNILNFKSYPQKTVFAAEWNYFVGEDNIVDQVDFDNIKQLILNKEKEVIAQYPYTSDWETGLGENSMTSRSDNFNLLKLPEAESLKIAIRKTYNTFLLSLGMCPEPDIYLQCWANVLRKNQKIQRHRHWYTNYSYLCGHICVQQENTNTNYISPFTGDAYPSPNETGKITLFPGWLEHYTDEHTGDSERITIAFDLIPTVTWTENIADNKKDHWVKITDENN